ncbi:MAG: AAA family ATPase, partial [Deltaproteobacteria bacterium]|nr:AAA family ATPase [Deltaproteobacteria bacterium]
MNLHTVHQESERRLTTVLFADISGFTAMSEKMDPEEVTVLMNSCFLMMERIIEKYGGTIDKFIGDCVMATFGAPLAIENAAQKSVRTALEIQTGLQRFNREKNFEVHLDVHVGINTGTVVAGKVGGDRKREYTVMGDTVNIASRLESISKKGQILVGPDTYNAAKSIFEFRKLKPISLKGKSEIFPVYELLPFQNLIHQKESPKRSLIFSDLVGRDTEIALLESSLKKLAAGRGGIINLIGEAGIGKSRLVAEVRKKEIWNRIAFLEGRCISIGRNFSFYPFNTLLQNWAGINENDNERIAFRKLERSVSAVLGEKTQDALPFIAAISGIALPEIYDRRVRDLEGEALEILILKSMKELFSKLSLKKPLVILMEDFHWSDKSSTKFFSALYPLSKNFPILFFAVLRPEYDKNIEKTVDEVRIGYSDQYTEIMLQALTESQSSILINNLMNIPGMPIQIRDQIMARADGNPFFIEEVVRSFVDIGAVVMKDGCYEITERMKDVSIPHTVNDVVMARIDRLDDSTRGYIRIASVIGRSFFHRILSEVSGDEENIDSCLENLKEMQFIRERRRMEEMEYVFKHALAQETAYASILIQKRRDLHRKTAVAIEKVFAGRLNEFYGMLSYHYISGDDMDKAESYLLKAGEEALKSGASSEALYYYQEAMEIYVKKFGDKVNPMKMAMIQKQIALSFYNKGQYNEAFEYYTKALSGHNIRIPENRFLFLPGFAVAFVNFFISLYFPALKWKRYPEKHEMEAIEIFYYRIATLVYLDSRRFFLESFFLSRYLSKFDLVKIKDGIGRFAGLSVAFSW